MIAISESARSEVPYPLNFVGVVHHGLPMQQFVPSKRGVSDYFVWLGRFVSDKGTHHAIRVAKEAGVKLVLAGTIDRHLPDAENYFHTMVKPHVDNDQIKHIGPVNMKEKIRLLSRARGFLNPIEWEEPFGMVMIEAMALGCPVISFVRGAAPEIVVHRKTGFLVHDIEEMVKFIPRVDGIDRSVTREHVEKNFSAHAMAEKYIKVYKKVIRKKREAATYRYGEIKTDKPLITPPPVPKKVVSVQVPYRTAQAAMVKVELEPKP